MIFQICTSVLFTHEYNFTLIQSLWMLSMRGVRPVDTVYLPTPQLLKRTQLRPCGPSGRPLVSPLRKWDTMPTATGP